MKHVCVYCAETVDTTSPDTWQQVRSWVHGPKRDGATLRENTDTFACTPCIDKLKAGQSPDQDDLFGEPEPDGVVRAEYNEGFDAGWRGDKLCTAHTPSYIAGYEAGQTQKSQFEGERLTRISSQQHDDTLKRVS